MNEREEQLQKMLTGGIKAQWERLNDPKNASKGKFSDDIEVVKKNIEEEHCELDWELSREKIIWERTRDEAADLKNYLDDLIMICDEKIAKKKQK